MVGKFRIRRSLTAMISKSEKRILEQFGISSAAGSLSDVVRACLPTKNALKFLESLSPIVSLRTLLRVVGIAQCTLKRRSGKRLRPDQSDRLVRVARVIDFAEASIGTRSRAIDWLSVPNRALLGARPIEDLDTDAGAKQVETVLGRLREGTVA
jgi:putative toxin-antitoxin system antitoxin component (TIGR02293 family)